MRHAQLGELALGEIIGTRELAVEHASAQAQYKAFMVILLPNRCHDRSSDE